MKLFEFEAKSVFAKHGIRVPKGEHTAEPKKVRALANGLGCPVVLKAQVLVGGRGKAGGIKFASTPSVEEKLRIEREYYLGMTVDRSERSPVILASSTGGIEIEELARAHPDRIIRRQFDPLLGLCEFEARLVAKKMEFAGSDLTNVSSAILRLWKIMREFDAELVEINPLVKTVEGVFIAADARLNIDDNALFRHKDFESRITNVGELNKREIQAREAGMSYVELDGDVSIIGNGAGLVMATLDMVDLFGGRPADFLDVGGGASSERMIKALQIVGSQPNAKVVLINILGGITRCDDMARGIIEAKNSAGINIPLVVRMVGTNEAEGKRILDGAEIDVLDTMEDAAKKAVEMSCLWKK
jgi:succinyl-CoA synthetase beta subunit